MLLYSGVEKSIQNSILFMNSIFGERKKNSRRKPDKNSNLRVYVQKPPQKMAFKNSISGQYTAQTKTRI